MPPAVEQPGVLLRELFGCLMVRMPKRRTRRLCLGAQRELRQEQLRWVTALWPAVRAMDGAVESSVGR